MLDLCHWKPLAGCVVRGRSGGTYGKMLNYYASETHLKQI